MEKEIKKTTIRKNKNADVSTKSGKKYSYQYVDISQIHEYLEQIKAKYVQQIKRIEGDDYVMTKRCFGDKWEEEWLQGCRVVQAVLFGNDNPAQEQGSALTYARRYSLLMAFGLATEDNDAKEINVRSEPEITTKEDAEKYIVNFGTKHKGKTLKEILEKDPSYLQYIQEKTKNLELKKAIKLLGTCSKEEQELILIYMEEMHKLEFDTDTEHEELLKYFNIKSDTEMTLDQLKEAVQILKKKLDKVKKGVF